MTPSAPVLSRNGLTLVFLAALTLVALPAFAARAPEASLLAASVLLAAILAVLSAIDVEEFRLPDVLTLPLTAAGVLVAWLASWGDPVWRIVAAAAGYLMIWLAAEAYRAWRGRDGVGMGDAKLMAAAGAWLGVLALPSVLLWAALIALGWAGLAKLAGREIAAETRLPFGPFIALGLWIVWLYGPLA